MNNWKRGLGTVAILILILAVTAACGSGNNASTPAAERPPASTSNEPAPGGGAEQAAKPFEGETISFVTANHPWGDAIKPLLPEFEQATGITVNVESFFEDQLTQKLTVQFLPGRQRRMCSCIDRCRKASCFLRTDG